MSEIPDTTKTEKDIDDHSNSNPHIYKEFFCFGLICFILGAGIGYGVHSMLPYTVEKTTLAYMIDRAQVSYGENIAGVNGETIAMSLIFGNFNNQTQILIVYWVIDDELVFRNNITLDDGSDGSTYKGIMDLHPNDHIAIFSHDPTMYITIAVVETFRINPIAQKIAELKAN